MSVPTLKRAVLGALAALATGALAPAQTPQQIVGGGVVAGTQFLFNQNYCNAPARVCGPFYGPPPTPNAGGTAYDPGLQTIWDTNGVLLIGVSAVSTPACQIVCPPAPVPVVPGALASGLAFDDGTRSLWMVDTFNNLTQMRVPFPPPVNQPPQACPVVVFRCALPPAPAGMVPAGLAISERWQQMFVSYSNFAGGPPANFVMVLPLATPCVPVCRFPVPLCPSPIPTNVITGLGFDDCLSELYWTDGPTVTKALYLPTLCNLGVPQCCPAIALAPNYYGLCIEAGHPGQVGASCTGGTCPVCPAMQHYTNDASIGNGAYSLVVTNAPAGSIAIGLLGLGPCTPGIPVLCGALYTPVPPAPIVLPPMVLPGLGGVCSGAGFMTIGMPMDPSLCGARICTQFAIVCLPGLSIGLTNGVTTVITDT